MIETGTTYLGPARLDGSQVRLPDGRTLAARRATPLRPADGDEVLVIANDDETAWILGVVDGGGDTVLSASGRLILEAPEISIRGGRIELWATQLLQKAQDLYSWVAGLFHVDSRRVKIDVQETAHVKAERTYLQARETMNIDGKTIHLG